MREKYYYIRDFLFVFGLYHKKKMQLQIVLQLKIKIEDGHEAP